MTPMRRARAAASARFEESFTMRRVERWLGRGAAPRRFVPTERPIGAKLEITHTCNLRCDFCYTDSPRRTLERRPEIDDETWLGVVEEAIALGVIEAVVSGGEPLLRRDLTLRVLERLDAAGVGVTLNTNGWFVDAELADHLATLRGLRVAISVDGASPALHDAARGVPGSWRRAVRALALLIERDVHVVVAHVVTPLNQRWVGDLLEHLWVLGVRYVRVTPVVPTGAASRSDNWTIDRPALRRAVGEARSRFGEDFEVTVQGGTGESVALRDGLAPAALLVRPDGGVLLDSLHPFSFGHIDDGLAAAWERIRVDWQHPDVTEWARGIRSARGFADAPVIAYADDPHPVGAGLTDRAATRPAAPRLPRRSARSTVASAPPDDLADARRQVLELALNRRHRLAPLRWSGDPAGSRVVRLTEDGRTVRLNRTAGPLMDRLAGGSVGDAAAALAAEHPDASLERVQLDVLRTVRWLSARGVVRGGVSG